MVPRAISVGVSGRALHTTVHQLGENILTLMSEIPRALEETQPAISSHSFLMNWWGTTNTSRSAPAAASQSSGTATWWETYRQVQHLGGVMWTESLKSSNWLSPVNKAFSYHRNWTLINASCHYLTLNKQFKHIYIWLFCYYRRQKIKIHTKIFILYLFSSSYSLATLQQAGVNPASRPESAGIGSTPPVTPKGIKWWIDRWMDSYHNDACAPQFPDSWFGWAWFLTSAHTPFYSTNIMLMTFLNSSTCPMLLVATVAEDSNKMF